MDTTHKQEYSKIVNRKTTLFFFYILQTKESE
jgi:hypothetical protein